MRAHALALIELTDAEAEGRLAGAEDVPSHAETRSNIVVVVVDQRAVNARGHFPTEAAALKCVYLAIMSLDPTGKGQQRWSNRWKAALNAFEITFNGRLSA